MLLFFSQHLSLGRQGCLWSALLVEFWEPTVPCSTCERLSEVGLLAPFLTAAQPTHLEKPIASVPNVHRKPLLTTSLLSYAIFKLCLLSCAQVSKFTFSQGEAFVSMDVSEHAFGFSMLSTWLLRNLDLFSYYFHLWVESPTTHKMFLIFSMQLGCCPYSGGAVNISCFSSPFMVTGNMCVHEEDGQLAGANLLGWLFSLHPLIPARLPHSCSLSPPWVASAL